jgi:hypothetical protein
MAKRISDNIIRSIINSVLLEYYFQTNDSYQLTVDQTFLEHNGVGYRDNLSRKAFRNFINIQPCSNPSDVFKIIEPSTQNEPEEGATLVVNFVIFEYMGTTFKLNYNVESHSGEDLSSIELFKVTPKQKTIIVYE